MGLFVLSFTMEKSHQRKLDGFFTVSTPRKRQLDEEAESRKQPSSKRRNVTGFPKDWAEKYQWIVDDINGMFCSLCIKHNRHARTKVNGKHVWTESPCISYREDSIKRHVVSQCHKEALEDERNAILGSQLQDAFQQELNINQKAVTSAMKCIYWICREELPLYNTYRSLIDLCRDNLDTDCLKALHCADNAKYMSNRFVEEVVTTTGRVLADGQHKEILASPFYSIMLDETTDVDVKKELIIYIRYLRNGTSMTCFNRMLELKDGKAETITDAVINLLHSHQLPLQNLCGLGSDGASVMIGHRGGVSALLKQQVPHLISNHCVAHRLALASSQSANQIPYLKKFKAIVEQLYRFYNYSPVRTAALKEIQAVLNDPVIKITQAKDVRWLSHDRAVQSIRLCLESVVTSLEREAQERSDVQAMGLSVFIQTYEFIAALMMMSDVLPILTRLSKAMQKRDLDYSFISPLVTAARSSIAALKDSPGEHFASLQQKMEDLVEKPFRFKSPSESAVASFKKNIYDKFLGNIEENLVKRFPNIPLLEAFSVFQFQDMEEDMNYGTEQIKLLCQHFRLEEEAGLLEWSAVVAMAKADEHFRTKPASEVMGKLTGQQEAFPILAKLCCAGLLIPTSTADCERGFSSLRRIKTELRNKLKGDVLNSLIMISLEGPSCSIMDINKVFTAWSQDKSRRCNQ